MAKDAKIERVVITGFILAAAGALLGAAPGAGAGVVGVFVGKAGEKFLGDAFGRIVMGAWRKKKNKGKGDPADRLADLAAATIVEVLRGAAKSATADPHARGMLEALGSLRPAHLRAAIAEAETAWGAARTPGVRGSAKVSRKGTATARHADLLHLVGASAGVAGARQGSIRAWEQLLLSARRAQGAMQTRGEITPGQRGALAMAASTLTSEFGNRFAANLMADDEDGKGALAYAQVALLRAIGEGVQKVRATTEGAREELKHLRRWLVGTVEACSAEALEERIARDGNLPDQLRELRTLAWTQLEKSGKVLASAEALGRNTEKIREIVAGGPRLRSLDPPGAAMPRMVYTARRVPMVGRAAERYELREFLMGDQPVSWWLWHGPAGMGKSRLALELCREFDRSWLPASWRSLDQRSAWVAGFLEADASTPHDWGHWRPTKPTLIVVDYTLGRADEVGRWIAQVCEAQRACEKARPREFFPRVRFLLLDRAADKLLLARLRGTGQRSQEIDAAQYRRSPGAAEPPRALGEFTEKQLREMVDHLYDLNDAAKTATVPRVRRAAPEKIVEAFRKKKQSLRPLFITLAADAVCRGATIGSLNEEELARDWLEGEFSQWASLAGARKADSGKMLRFRALMVLATMVRGLPMEKGYEDLHRTIAADGLRAMFPRPTEYESLRPLLSRFCSLGDHEHKGMIPPLEPDYFGELMALDYLEAHAGETPVRHAWVRAAVRLRPMEFAQWLTLVVGDFSGHEQTQALMDDVESERADSPFAEMDEMFLSIVRIFLAIMMKRQGDHGRALRFFKLAKRPPDSIIGLVLNLLIYAVEAGGDLVRAEEMHRRAVAVAPDDVEVVTEYATFLWQKRKDRPEAEKFYRRAIELAPDQAGVHLKYAIFLSGDENRKVESEKHLHRAWEINPDYFGSTPPPT